MKYSIDIFDSTNELVYSDTLLETITKLVELGFRPMKKDTLFDKQGTPYSIRTVEYDYQIKNGIPTFEWTIYLKEKYKEEE